MLVLRASVFVDYFTYSVVSFYIEFMTGTCPKQARSRPSLTVTTFQIDSSNEKDLMLKKVDAHCSCRKKTSEIVGENSIANENQNYL